MKRYFVLKFTHIPLALFPNRALHRVLFIQEGFSDFRGDISKCYLFDGIKKSFNERFIAQDLYRYASLEEEEFG